MTHRRTIGLYIYEGVLLVFIICASLFGGSISALPLYFMEMLSLILILYFFLHYTNNSHLKIIYPSSFWCMVVFFVYIMAQCLPLPLSVLQSLSPKTALLYRQFLSVGSEQRLFRLSIYPFATQQGTLELLCLFSVFFVTINVIDKKKAN